MTLAHVAGGEEMAGIRRAHVVGDAGVGIVHIPLGTVGRLVAEYSDVWRDPVPRKVAALFAAWRVDSEQLSAQGGCRIPCARSRPRLSGSR
ncbi:hypothetical protein MRX96_024545 [Rhipicephalus microplus]